MKKLVVFAVLAAIVASCADDNPPQIEKSNELVSPRLLMDVSTESGQSPLTGILTIMPCKAGTSIYYGNYVNQKLTPFYGYYQIKDGTFYNAGVNRELSLPTGPYNMIYWGTPQYKEPIYAHPALKEPAYIIGKDMSQQHFSLFNMGADTTYYPVFDLVHTVQPANIGSEDLKASLKRVVTGLKVIIKDKNNGILSSSIDSVVVRIANIAGELNFYTAAPQGSPRTVAFPLVRSVDGTQMSNATVMLFPSFGEPEFQMSIILKNGNVKSFKQTLNGHLEANSNLTLPLTLGDIFSEESSGEFTIDNWNEESQTIDVPSLD
ncbi:FimB/Mfa2 family fimbrial subunit [Bacteroides rodentium]